MIQKFRRFRRFFRIDPSPIEPAAEDVVDVHAHRMPILYRRHARARNYVLRLYANRTVVVTMPRAGTKKFARSFVASRQHWLEKQWRILETRKIAPEILRPGMEILFRGQPVVLQVEQTGLDWRLRFGNESAPLLNPEGNLRPALERRLHELARTVLTERALELARLHELHVKHVTVRNQKRRWGSCSCGRTISLNWRLIQLPDDVRDYIILHELMHLRELNHSPKFWAAVEQVCPSYRAAENWLKKNSGQVGF